MADLDDLWDEMATRPVFACSLRDPRWHLEGLAGKDGAVYVDERTAILGAVLHELVHHAHPKMHETSVIRETRRLLGSMDESTKAKWWRGYLSARQKIGPVDVEN